MFRKTNISHPLIHTFLKCDWEGKKETEAAWMTGHILEKEDMGAVIAKTGTRY